VLWVWATDRSFVSSTACVTLAFFVCDFVTEALVPVRVDAEVEEEAPLVFRFFLDAPAATLLFFRKQAPHNSDLGPFFGSLLHIVHIFEDIYEQ
jgi:hypothetical protein